MIYTWWFQPLWKNDFVSWDDEIPNWMESHKIHILGATSIPQKIPSFPCFQTIHKLTDFKSPMKINQHPHGIHETCIIYIYIVMYIHIAIITVIIVIIIVITIIIIIYIYIILILYIY